ncbi:MAG TPA: low molecular weight protein-tyrosine-phosphatase [Gemmatimonadales bacterium]|nr:low molecular weight protein-tyrosine-phosphatase [Gemmatimonadales bacterium]
MSLERAVRTALRPLVRLVRGSSAWLLHPSRRQSTRAAITAMPPIRRILFICHGNICRSPYAAAWFRRRLEETGTRGLTIESAGFVGGGRSSPTIALEVARQRGIDMTRHVSQVATIAHWQRADLVVVMEPAQKRSLEALHGRTGRTVIVLGDLDPNPVFSRSIPDPIEKPAAVFEAGYRRIERCVDALVALCSVDLRMPPRPVSHTPWPRST